MVVTIPTREQVPVEETWDLAPLYADEAAWEADFARVEGARDAVVARRGTLGESPASLAGALDARATLDELLERLFVYAMLRRVTSLVPRKV